MLIRIITLASILLTSPAAPLARATQDSRPATPPASQPAIADPRPLEFPPPSPFGLGRGKTEEDLRELVAMWPKLLEQSAENARMREGMAERIFAKHPELKRQKPAESRPARPETKLPDTPLHETMWFTHLAEVVEYARPLWRSKTWNATELAKAELIDSFLRLMDGAPRLECRAGEVEANIRKVDALVRWYWACIDKPETFAKMIFSMDMGPYVGVPLEANVAGLERVAERELGESMTLELCRRADDAEPFVFRLWHDDKVVWARVVSDSPKCTVREAELTGDPSDGGVYGWFVPFAVKWSGGHERASLYLGPNGEFRFYFMSW